jgi:hypothetical protein
MRSKWSSSSSVNLVKHRIIGGLPHLAFWRIYCNLHRGARQWPYAGGDGSNDRANCGIGRPAQAAVDATAAGSGDGELLVAQGASVNVTDAGGAHQMIVAITWAQ